MSLIRREHSAMEQKMRSSASQKNSCSICGRAQGSFTCRGCERNFCTRHVTEHRQMLNREVDELNLLRDRYQQTLVTQMAQPQQHALVKEIDQWEEESIKKIQLAAKTTRQQIQKIISQHAHRLNDVLSKMSHDLRKAREEGNFFEGDLRTWTEKLHRLKDEFIKIPNVQIREEDKKRNLFISRIGLSIPTKETFAQSIGNIQIEDDGQLIVKDLSDDYATVRALGEYSSGEHRFSLKIQPNQEHKWLFIGIISKDMPLQFISYDNPSSYGWAGNNRVFLNGVFTPGFNDYDSDLLNNDLVEFIMDCDQQRISLTNQRTRKTFELDIDIDNCPFPWQLNLNLYWANDRVRLLSS